MSMDTPFDLVYREIVDSLYNDPTLAVQLRERTLVQFDDQRTNPQKKRVQSADLPEVVVYMRSVRGNLHATSSTLRLTTVWPVIISTGVYDTQLSNAIVFSVLRIAVDWKSTLAPLVWRSKDFVKDVRLVTSDSGESNPQYNRNITGWVTLLELEIDLSFLTTDFLLGLIE